MKLTISLEKQSKKAKELENKKKKTEVLEDRSSSSNIQIIKFQKKKAEKMKGRDNRQNSSRKLPKSKGWVLSEQNSPPCTQTKMNKN